MKRELIYLLSILIWTLQACTGSEADLLSTPGEGFSVTLTHEANPTVSRSTPAELGKPATEQFRLTVFSHRTLTNIYDGGFTDQPVAASAGSYTLTASCGTDVPLGLDCPYYFGTTDAEVTKGQTTAVSITCRVANSLLSVNYANPEIFDQLYNSYGVKVKVGNRSVVMNHDSDSGKSAYFPADSRALSVTFVATTTNGTDVEYPLDLSGYLPLKAADHAQVTLRAAQVGLSVEKVEVRHETLSNQLPPEWLPKPKVNGFADLTYTETDDAPSEAVISYTAATPVQDAELTLSFGGNQYTDYSKTYQLSALTPDERNSLDKLGIELPVAGETTEGTIDLRPLTATLQTNAGADALCTFALRIKANNRWSDDDAAANVSQIKVVKPEFSIGVQPGNCWSKEFTIDEVNVTKGNADRIKADLAYQYSADGGTTWTDCSAGNKQVFADYPSAKDYKVRAIFRQALTTNMLDVTLESPRQLPNAGMEDWYIETKKKSNKTYYTFHPYANGQGASSWWDTNNDLAQGGTIVFGIWYEGCFASCVSYTDDPHSGSKAALIYLSGCGNSYANTAGTYLGGAMVGSLFIGKYSGGIVEGHDFDMRPTALSFWYKYKPYGTDAYKVVISLRNQDKTLATAVYSPTATATEDAAYQQVTVPLNYTDEVLKATTICVQFLASNKTSLSQSDFALGTHINYPTIGNWQVHMGSVLKIDDISLIYDR